MLRQILNPTPHSARLNPLGLEGVHVAAAYSKAQMVTVLVLNASHTP